jgi:hypothetical protein
MKTRPTLGAAKARPGRPSSDEREHPAAAARPKLMTEQEIALVIIRLRALAYKPPRRG